MESQGEVGLAVGASLTFDQERTDICQLLESVHRLFGEWRSERSGPWQLNVILSDGICESHERVLSLVRAGLESQVVHVFVILDHGREQESIAELSHVQYYWEGGVQRARLTRYLDTFPFDYYVVLRDMGRLPRVLAAAIRQWFDVLSVLD